MRCHACGELLPLSARTCHACGVPVAREPAASPPGPAAAVPEQLQVVAGGAAMLDRPFAAARLIQRLAPGTVVTVLSQQWGFVHAETADGRRGFVERATLVPLQPPAPRSADVSSPPAGPPPAPASEEVTPTDPQGAKRHDPSGNASGLPFNIPFLEGEQVRYRAVFLYNPREDRALVVTNRRVIVTGGAFGNLPRVLPLEEITAVQLRDSGSGSTNGEGNLYLTLAGVPTPLHVGGVLMPHRVRDEILAACAERGAPAGGGRPSGRRVRS